MRIGVIGGGMLGLTLGYYLHKLGHTVHIYERNNHLGGLSCSFDYGDFVWDKFYHVIMSHDRHLLELLTEIGLKNDLCWSKAEIGYFANGNYYSLNNFQQMLAFPLISWFDKVRMSLAILYSLSLIRPTSLYTQTAKTWLVKVFGESNYATFWKPLLRAKFGAYTDKIAAVFIWASLRRLFGARLSRNTEGTTGYVRGGYHRILATLREYLESDKNAIFLPAKIQRVGLASEISRNDRNNDAEHENQCGIKFSINDMSCETNWYDKVIFTAPKQHALPIISEKLRNWCTDTLRDDGESTKYLGVVCLNVVLSKNLTQYYMLNIDAETVPLTGIIEMTNVIDPASETEGLTLVYLPRYVDSGDAFLKAGDAYVYEQLFSRGLKRLFPDLNDDDVVSWHVQRASHVQPLTLAKESVVTFENKLPNLDCPFVFLNSSNLACPALNNNEIVGLAKEAAAMFTPDQACRLDLNLQAETTE